MFTIPLLYRVNVSILHIRKHLVNLPKVPHSLQMTDSEKESKGSPNSHINRKPQILEVTFLNNKDCFLNSFKDLKGENSSTLEAV